MGRVSRYKKIKPFDPFAKNRKTFDFDDGRNDPVNIGVDDGLSKRFKRQALLIQQTKEKLNGMQARKKEKRREKRNTDNPRARLPSESLKAFKRRMQMENKKAILEHSMKVNTLSERRKEFLKEKKSEKKAGKQGEPGGAAAGRKRQRAVDDGEGGLWEEDVAREEEVEARKRTRKGKGKKGVAAQGKRGEGRGPASPTEDAAEPTLRGGRRRRTEEEILKTDVVKFGETVKRPPEFNPAMMKKMARAKEHAKVQASHRAAREEAMRDAFAHKRNGRQAPQEVKQVSSRDVEHARHAATEAYAKIRKQRLERAEARRGGK